MTSGHMDIEYSQPIYIFHQLFRDIELVLLERIYNQNRMCIIKI